ncbi:type IV secretion system DNA-binding domain-containing protein [Rhizobium leguminosarum]|uniref:type IV secretion system DNA-binding domain-containing protein n=1 Tax=Rhizobium leguminosarum TaxID=384 RepID=UPI0013EF4269|nr:type IV secretion system DNA-binding domain-containing protein [Rhizobium leguminosarum]
MILFRLSKLFLRSTDYLFAFSRNPALNGDLIALGEQKMPREKHPAAWVRVPDDLYRPMWWDGYLINGYDVADLAKWKMSAKKIATVSALAGRHAIILCGFLMAALVAINFVSVAQILDQTMPEFPSWAFEANAYGALAAWTAAMAVAVIWAGAAIIAAYGVPILLLMPIFWFFSLMNGLGYLWESQSWRLRLPTRDALVLYKQNKTRRENTYLAWTRQVLNATTWLADKPVFPIGVATGYMRSMGDIGAPLKGQFVCMDGDSARQHTLILGGTGSGKSMFVMEPMFSRIMSANWGEGHRIGAYVTDGKGVLYKDFLKYVDKRDDVKIVGVADDQFAIDLVRGMTPAQISDTFKGVSIQLLGNPSDSFWIEMASLVIMHAAMIAQGFEYSERGVKEFTENEGFRPYSLAGIALIATNEIVCKGVSEVVRELRNKDEENKGAGGTEKTEILKQAVKSTNWIKTNFWEIATETRTGIVSNINSVIGKLDGAPDVARRFCYGTCPADKLIDVDHALNGGIIMVAVGGATHGLIGHLVTVWIKSRLYMRARRRMTELSKEELSKTSCAMFADEYQMLVTSGSDDSDSKIWNISRASGLFLIAATQSVAAMRQAMGADGCANLLNLLRTKILLKTEEESTLNYFQTLLGESLQAVSGHEDLFSSPDQIEEQKGGIFGKPVYQIDKLAGLWSEKFNPQTRQRKPYKGGGISTMIDELPPEQQAQARLQHAMRMEDQNRAATTENLQYRKKIDFDVLLTGNGLALVMAQRAGGTRTDMVDLQALAQA